VRSRWKGLRGWGASLGGNVQHSWAVKERETTYRGRGGCSGGFKVGQVRGTRSVADPPGLVKPPLHILLACLTPSPQDPKQDLADKVLDSV
jgi:hypothetical protein